MIRRGVFLAVAAVAATAGSPRQGPEIPSAAERAAFRASLVSVRDSDALRWRPLRGATGYEVLSSGDGRHYGLEDLVTSTSYHVKSSGRSRRIWFRVVAMRSAKTLLDTTTAVIVVRHATD